MNIFILDLDLRKNAEYHVDRHVSKLITEACQLLSNAYYYTNEEHLAPYKLTHKNHPCSVFARESLSNWLWLQELAIELYIEYQYRYGGKIHKSGETIINMTPPSLKNIGMTKYRQCMPDDYKCDDIVKAYRTYYIKDKKHLFAWKNRNIPDWVKINIDKV